MKKRILALVMAVVMLAGIVPAGMLVSVAEEKTVTVTFNYDGSLLKKDIVVKGTSPKVTKPVDPELIGCKFLGWYEDKGFTKAYNFNTVLTEDKELFAKWDANESYLFDSFETPPKSLYKFFADNNITDIDSFFAYVEGEDFMSDLMDDEPLIENGTAQNPVQALNNINNSFYVMIFEVMSFIFTDVTTVGMASVEAQICYLKSQIFFDDAVKLIESAESENISKIFMTLLEIFPDFIYGTKKGLDDDPAPEATPTDAGASATPRKDAGDKFMKNIISAAKKNTTDGIFEVAPQKALFNILGKEKTEAEFKVWKADSYFDTIDTSDPSFESKWASVPRVAFVMCLDLLFCGNPEVVKAFLHSQIVFDDVVKLLEALQTSDTEIIDFCIGEISPDMITGALKITPDDFYTEDFRKSYLNVKVSGTALANLTNNVYTYGDKVAIVSVPACKLYFDTDIIVDKFDYSYTYYDVTGGIFKKLDKSPTDAGKYQLVVEAAGGKGKYYATQTIPFEILPKPITSVTLDNYYFANDGQFHCPEITSVRAGNFFLSPDDYDIFGLIPSFISGDYSFVVAAKEDRNFCGKIKVDWNIGAPCVYDKEVPLENGVYNLYLGGKSVGAYLFTRTDNNKWLIQDKDGNYLACVNAALTRTEDPFEWNYVGGVFTVTQANPKSAGLPAFLNFILKLFGIGTTVDYFLASDNGNIAVSRYITAAAVKTCKPFGGEHKYGKTPVSTLDGNHVYTCSVCGNKKSEDCKYGDDHRCICGFADPAVASVDVNVYVEKNMILGIFPYRKAKITVQTNVINAVKVEYSIDGAPFITGTSFTRLRGFDTVAVRVTDISGKIFNFVYADGITKPVEL